MTEKPIQSKVEVTGSKLYLYGTIGDPFDGVTLDDIVSETKDMKRNHLDIYINSYGGVATEGVAIFNFLKREFETIHVYVDGIAASSASLIALCGEKLTVPKNAIFMIHQPWTFTMGNRKDLEKEMNALESLEEAYQSTYMERFKGTKEELIALLDDETWLNGEEAEQLGFADKASEEIEIEPEESPLVASLVKKYVAQANSDDTEEVEPEEKIDTEEEIEPEEDSTTNGQETVVKNRQAMLKNLVTLFDK